VGHLDPETKHPLCPHGNPFPGFRTFLWIFYRPFLPASQDTAPSLSVIIPAYNEGAMVQKAIHSVLAAQYPREKLEIFIIDDGSKDDTWVYIKKLSSITQP
jgi:hyaluronan synthase